MSSGRLQALQSPLHKLTHEALIGNASLFGFRFDGIDLALRHAHVHAGRLVLEFEADGFELREVRVGKVLLEDFLIAFEGASILLLAATVAAIILAGRRRENKDGAKEGRS